MQSHQNLEHKPLSSQLQRILNPSHSTQQLLQQQFQCRINSIQQSLTTRSNFLSLFQQMLEEEIKNNQNTVESGENENRMENENDVGNVENNNDGGNSENKEKEKQQKTNNDRENYKLQNIAQLEEQKTQSVQVQQRLGRQNNCTIQQQQTRRIQNLNQTNSSNQKFLQSSYNRQTHQTIETTEKFMNVETSEKFVNIETSEKLMNTRQKISQQQIKNVTTTKYLKQKLSLLNPKLEQLISENKKLKYFVQSSFNWLKSFLIDQIFKKNLQKIVQTIQSNYEQKYDQKIKEIQQTYCKMTSEYKREISQLKQQLLQSELKVSLNLNQKEKVYDYEGESSIQLNFLDQIQKNQNSLLDTSQIKINSDESKSMRQQSNKYLMKNLTETSALGAGVKRVLKERQVNEQNIARTIKQPEQNCRVRPQNNESLTMRVLREVGFTILIPASLPQIRQKPSQNQQPSFSSISSSDFTFKGYVDQNNFINQGKLQLKRYNLTYEGQFKNHKLNGKGKLTLSGVQLLSSRQQQSFTDTNHPSRKSNTMDKKDQQIILTVIGNFSENRIDGYSKVSVRLVGDSEKRENEVFVLWKDSRVVHVL